jgi:long-chain fatty acid transport protein
MRQSTQFKKTIASLLSVATLVCASQAHAGAFQLWEESGASLGDYHAGGAAEANNASSVFYNPAGMARMHQTQVSMGAAFVALQGNFTGQKYINVDGFVIPAGTVSNAPGDTFNIVPNFHIVMPINDRIALGFEETTPFGLSTNYGDAEDSNPVSYLATETELQTMNLNPSVSYRINQYLSLGVGFDALYGKAIYDNFGFIAPLNNNLSGWGYGYNAGALVEFTPETRFGASYRSAITVPATGKSTLGSETSNVSAKFPLPATTMLSVYHDVNQKLAVMASAFYTQWSCFNELIIRDMAQPSGTPPATIGVNENYRNTWNFAVGGRYWFNEHIGFEMGAGHDSTPTRLPYRDIRLPDGDRYALSMGLNLRPSKSFQWNMGWTHFFTDTTLIDNLGGYNPHDSTLNPAEFVTAKGSVAADVNVFGIQLTWII